MKKISNFLKIQKVTKFKSRRKTDFKHDIYHTLHQYTEFWILIGTTWERYPGAYKRGLCARVPLSRGGDHLILHPEICGKKPRIFDLVMINAILSIFQKRYFKGGNNVTKGSASKSAPPPLYTNALVCPL